ncbi:PerC family transcriptional regulator [Salmonella enterica subsp. enterica serovar Braenderup str. CFSAN001755]|nr:PerC family transcriptional regulator [Salmonella enterica subsp. enterica serovar Braenderup]
MMSTSQTIICFLKQSIGAFYSAREISELNDLRLSRVHSTLSRLKKTGCIVVIGERTNYRFSYGNQPDTEKDMNTQKITLKMTLAEQLEQKGFYRRAAYVWGEALRFAINDESQRKMLVRRQEKAIQMGCYKNKYIHNF